MTLKLLLHRSAVEEGATHVLVLASRPEDFVPTTEPSIYETRIAPLYFNLHGYYQVSKFFALGGQQYLYAEDLLLLQEAARPAKEGVLVPPPKILYGVERSPDIEATIRDREQSWNRAHLYPLRVPKGNKELGTLEQDKDEVLEAVRTGFMTAFDALSDIVGLEGYKGKDVAALVFPSEQGKANGRVSSSLVPLMVHEEKILCTQVQVPGELLPEHGAAIEGVISGKNLTGRRRPTIDKRIRQRQRSGLFGCHHATSDLAHQRNGAQEKELPAVELLNSLPGFRDGRFSYLAKGLSREHLQGC